MTRFILGVLAACFTLPTAAQEWPTRSVTVVFPYRAGGGGETMIRTVMAKVSTIVGQQFVIENRAGAGGLIGGAAVARAKPDGYTLLVTGLGSAIVAPAMAEKMPFDPIKDLTQVALIGGPPPVLAVNESFPAKTLQQFVDYARGKAEGVSFASPGQGSHGHLVGELFSSRAKLKLTHVPYNGGGPAVGDLIAGHVPAGFMTLGSVSQQVASGKIRLLAVASAERVAAFPNVPTFAELGHKELTGPTWFGLAGPAQLPREITVKLNSAVRKALADPDVRAKLNTEAVEVNDLDPEKTAEFFRAEFGRWAPIARQVPKEAAGPAPKTETR